VCSAPGRDDGPRSNHEKSCSTTRRTSGAFRSVPWIGRSGPWSPYYLILRLPSEKKEEFVLLIPFTPSKKDNLAAWLAARSDPPHYGKLVVYNFPKQKLIYGPRQIEARIDQDPFISQQLSLWNQRGSQVIRGNLLVVPIERSLVYVEPLYIAAEKGQLPEPKRVIVGFGDRIAMEETLEGATARVFGGPAQRVGTEAAPSPPEGATGSMKALLDDAASALTRANEELRRLDELLRRLREVEQGLGSRGDPSRSSGSPDELRPRTSVRLSPRPLVQRLPGQPAPSALRPRLSVAHRPRDEEAIAGVIPGKQFTLHETGSTPLLQLPTRDQVLATLRIHPERLPASPRLCPLHPPPRDSPVLSGVVVSADRREVQHASALDLCKVQPADSQGSALHDSNRSGAVAQLRRRRLGKGPHSQERRGLQKALDRAVWRMRRSWTVTTPSVTAAPDGP
jgi:Uncharacterised protein family (UPF0182)